MKFVFAHPKKRVKSVVFGHVSKGKNSHDDGLPLFIPLMKALSEILVRIANMEVVVNGLYYWATDDGSGYGNTIGSSGTPLHGWAANSEPTFEAYVPKADKAKPRPIADGGGFATQSWGDKDKKFDKKLNKKTIPNDVIITGKYSFEYSLSNALLPYEELGAMYVWAPPGNEFWKKHSRERKHFEPTKSPLDKPLKIQSRMFAISGLSVSGGELK